MLPEKLPESYQSVLYPCISPQPSRLGPAWSASLLLRTPTRIYHPPHWYAEPMQIVWELPSSPFPIPWFRSSSFPVTDRDVEVNGQHRVKVQAMRHAPAKCDHSAMTRSCVSRCLGPFTVTASSAISVSSSEVGKLNHI